MNKILFNLLVCFIFLFSFEDKIQSQTVTIGNGIDANNSNTWPAPYGNYEYGARYQIIIKGSELTAAGGIAGNISAIAFDVSSVNGCDDLTNFTIKIGNSPKSDFESGASWVNENILTTAFISNSYQPVVGWNTHNFSNVFCWDGISDICIQTCFYNGTYSYNASTRYTTTSTRMVVGSEGSFDPCSNSTTPYRYYERPNIRLTMQTSGINDIFSKSNISIYPNPANDLIFIENHNNELRIEISNSVGQIVYKTQLNTSETIRQIDISGFAKGIYFLKVQNEENISVQKFIKQ